MKILMKLVVVLLFSCAQKNENSIGLLIVNKTQIKTNEFEDIYCLDQLNNNNLKEELFRVRKIGVLNGNSDEFSKLTIEDRDSLYWFNVELFHLSENDTLRVANFGGRDINKEGAVNSIKESLCMFLNK